MNVRILLHYNQISKDKTKVRRTQPVHHMAEEEADEKTVYVVSGQAHKSL